CQRESPQEIPDPCGPPRFVAAYPGHIPNLSRCILRMTSDQEDSDATMPSRGPRPGMSLQSRLLSKECTSETSLSPRMVPLGHFCWVFGTVDCGSDRACR